MCGIAGFIGVPRAQAWGLVYGLGAGIDARGGHAAGYVGIRGDELRVVKKIGEWSDASRRFIRGAARSDTCMMHARYATCGVKDSIDHAHPFEIERKNETVLYGAHNGVIWSGAENSAKYNKREYTVDSREVFELLADEEYEAIKNLDGYGVLTWIIPGTKHVNMLRLSEQSEIVVGQLKAGGLVWASTREILMDALDLAGLRLKYEYEVPTIGMAYEFRHDGVNETRLKDVVLGGDKTWYGIDESPDSWETAMIKKWQAEDDAQSIMDEIRANARIYADDPDPQLYSRWERGEDDEQEIEYPSIAGSYK